MLGDSKVPNGSLRLIIFKLDRTIVEDIRLVSLNSDRRLLAVFLINPSLKTLSSMVKIDPKNAVEDAPVPAISASVDVEKRAQIHHEEHISIAPLQLSKF